MTMTRIALGLRYNGAAYHGWQVQRGLPTVQRALESALSSVADHSVTVTCAGRTDRRVHATAQVVHFDTSSARSLRAWVFGANSYLPSDITVMWAQPVDSSFHARFSATQRTYRYVLYNTPVRPGIMNDAVGWWYRPLDLAAMAKASRILVGEHDFSSFRGAGCQAHSPVRTISQFKICTVGQMIVFEVSANAFLLHMVRNIVGSLIAVGDGRQTVTWLSDVLAAKDRGAASVTFCPSGLYLVAVEYPARYNLPAMSIGPFFVPEQLDEPISS